MGNKLSNKIKKQKEKSTLRKDSKASASPVASIASSNESSKGLPTTNTVDEKKDSKPLDDKKVEEIIEESEESEEKEIPRPVLKEVHKDECKICGQMFMKDESLEFINCGHRFCLNCIYSSTREKKPEVPCPLRVCDSLMDTKALIKAFKELRGEDFEMAQEGKGKRGRKGEGGKLTREQQRQQEEFLMMAGLGPQDI